MSEEDEAAKKANAQQPGNDGDGQSSGLGSGDMLEVREFRFQSTILDFEVRILLGPTLEQVSRADVRVPGEEARLRRGLPAELPHAGDALHPRPGDNRRTFQGQLDQNTRKVLFKANEIGHGRLIPDSQFLINSPSSAPTMNESSSTTWYVRKKLVKKTLH